MSWLKKIFGGETPAERYERDASTDDFHLAIVGESNYQYALRAARANLTQDDEGRLILPVRVECEPTNKFDRNAVRVTTIAGATLGYLPREGAALYCEAIARLGGSVICKAALFGGEPDKPSIGVWLDLCEPEDL